MAKTKAATKSKGFQLEQNTITLEFQGRFAGLEVEVVTDAPIDFVFRMGEVVGAPLKEQLEIIREFGDVVIDSWNYLHPKTGEPVTADGDGAVSLPFSLALSIIEAWASYIVGNDSNLEKPETEPDRSV